MEDAEKDNTRPRISEMVFRHLYFILKCIEVANAEERNKEEKNIYYKDIFRYFTTVSVTISTSTAGATTNAIYTKSTVATTKLLMVSSSSFHLFINTDNTQKDTHTLTHTHFSITFSTFIYFF